MVVVDDLDERLHLTPLVLACFRHPAGDLQRVSLDAGDESVRERVLLAAIVLGLDDDDLLSGVTSARDDGLREWLEEVQWVCFEGFNSYHTADLEDYQIVSDVLSESEEYTYTSLCLQAPRGCICVAEDCRAGVGKSKSRNSRVECDESLARIGGRRLEFRTGSADWRCWDLVYVLETFGSCPIISSISRPLSYIASAHSHSYTLSKTWKSTKISKFALHFSTTMQLFQRDGQC